MKWLLKFLDVQGEWIREHFTPVNQIRLGVVMTDLGLVLCLAVFWTDEPPIIFEMSALALLFGGVGTVVTAVLAKTTEDRDGDGQP